MEFVAGISGAIAKSADLRRSPGVLVLSASGKVLYMNRRAWELVHNVNKGLAPGAVGGGLPAMVNEVYQELQAIGCYRPHSKNREQIEVRRLAEGTPLPIIVRGMLLSENTTGDPQDTVIILEAVAPTRNDGVAFERGLSAQGSGTDGRAYSGNGFDQ